MTDPLQALESLVEKWRSWALTLEQGAPREFPTISDPMLVAAQRAKEDADELEPIIQQVREEMQRIMKERDVAWEGIEQLRAERERYREALERVQAFRWEAVEVMRRNGFKFETRLDLSEGFEKLAFTFYTNLCEVESVAKDALQASSPKEEEVDLDVFVKMDPVRTMRGTVTWAKDSDIPEKEEA